MNGACTVFPRDLVEPVYKHFNSIDMIINFTDDRDSGGCLRFLDVLLTRKEDGTISISGYRKVTPTKQ